MNSDARLEVFADNSEAAVAVAEAIVNRLSPPGPKHLMVTGGSTPGPVYDRLAETELDWSRVTVTLSDERFVPPTSPDSNERLVRERLLQDRAAAATFIPLKGQGRTPDEDAAAAEPAIRAVIPFDVALLGMGEDGHVASLFPSTPCVQALLDSQAERAVVGVEVAGVAPFTPRISLTGRALLNAGLILVLTRGEPKRALLERVLADPAFAPPVSAVIRQTKSPVRILWSPEAA